MSSSSDLIDQVIRGHVAPTMKRAGFKKSARNWHRDHVGVVAVINLQGSSWNGSDSARFTLNLGLWFPAVSEFVVAPPPKNRRPPEHLCTVRERIGFLMPESRDMWWNVSDESVIDALGEEVTRALVSFGLPWLERHEDPRRALDYLCATNYRGHSPVIALALALTLRDSALATALYHEWAASNEGESAARIRAWADAHGLALAAQPAPHP